ncbi:MAG: AMMECR1 domain-containing protein [Kofleriaceae bacterium]
MTDSIDAARSELLDLLCSDGIYWSTPEQPIVTASGTPARWMLDSMRVTLTKRGAELAARCLLDCLARFDVTAAQLATMGVTAVSLVDACVARDDRYHGLIVRKEKKAWGSMKLVEGPVDPALPVIIVDDSISSGTAMVRCLTTLEEAGLRVLGAVCLVRFAWYGGYARMQAGGYHMEHVFDSERDLWPRVDPDRERIPYNPSTIVPPFTYAAEVAPDGIHAAAYAREVLLGALHGTPVRRPPQVFDRPYDGAGGVWVSVRSRANIHQRHGRDGSWVFPSESPRDFRTELVHAAVRTAALIKDPALLASSAVAVTFFGALEEVSVGELDNDRYGIVVRSRERVEALGGALPRMPGMTREWAQFDHARTKNAKLLPREPYVLFRHTVDKAVEPDTVWQPTGVPVDRTPTWLDDPARAGRIAERAHAFVRATLAQEPPSGEPLPDALLGPCEALFVTVFADGRLAGCIGAAVTSLDGDLRRITERALDDVRFRGGPPLREAARIAVTVSLLTDAVALGEMAPANAVRYLRHGEDAMTVFQPPRAAVLIPFVALQQSYTREQFVAALVDKAGITRPAYRWGTYACTTWLADGEAPRKLVWHLPPRTPPATLAEGIARLAPLYREYLRTHTHDDGSRDRGYRPLTNTAFGDAMPAREIHGAWALAIAARDEASIALARRSLESCRLRFSSPGLVEEAFVLLASIALGTITDNERAIAERLRGAIDRQGRILWERAPFESPQDLRQDYEPAQILLALAHAADAGVAVERAAIDRALAVCMHRFRGRRRWGQVSWLPMALAAWHRVTGDATCASRAFEIIDWALTHQQTKSGGFINAEQPDGPGCTTAVYLEGVAAALELARATGDSARVERYRAAALRAVIFLDTLTYQDIDRPFLPDPARAIGGLRQSLVAGDVRTDFVQHALIALTMLGD